VLRALRVEVLSIDPGSPFLRATFSLVEASPAADGLGMMFRVVSPVLRDNVSLRASIRFPQGRPAARLRACILPVGAPFDVVTKEDLDWLTL